MSIFKHGLIVLGLAMLIAVSTSDAHAGGDMRCYEDWSDAGPVARAQRLMPVSEVLKAVRQGRDGRVVRIKLCSSADRYFYRVSFFANGGSVSLLRVDARSGDIHPLARP